MSRERRWMLRPREKMRGLLAEFPRIGGVLVAFSSLVRGESSQRRRAKVLALEVDAQLRRGDFIPSVSRIAPDTAGWTGIKELSVVEVTGPVTDEMLKQLKTSVELASDGLLVCVVRRPDAWSLDRLARAGIVAMPLEDWRSVEEARARVGQMFPNASQSAQAMPIEGARPQGASGTSDGTLSVNIIDYERRYGASWVLTVMADRLAEALTRRGITVAVSTSPLPGFDVHHHMPYYAFDGEGGVAVDSILVTHLDVEAKIRLVGHSLAQGATAICMSSDTAMLLGKALPDYQARITWVVPPPLRGSQPRIAVGCFFRLYKDDRKRAAYLVQVARIVGGELLHVVVMGEGWEDLAQSLLEEGCTVEHIRYFDADDYVQRIRAVDFALYFGTDEGAMFFLDALSMGTRVIVPFVGYHTDLPHPLVIYAHGPEEVASVMGREIQLRASAHALAEQGGWDHYADAHLRVWGMAARCAASGN